MQRTGTRGRESVTRTHVSRSQRSLSTGPCACADVQQGRESLSADTCGLTCYVRCSHLLQSPLEKSSLALFSAFHTGQTKHPSPMSTRLVLCPSSTVLFFQRCVFLSALERSRFLVLPSASCFVSHPLPPLHPLSKSGVRKSFRALNRLFGSAASRTRCFVNCLTLSRIR